MIRVVHGQHRGISYSIRRLRSHEKLRAAGFQTREISAFVAQGRIERVKPPRTIYPLIKPFFFRERFYTPAIEHIQNQAGTVY